jgi:hypothetical protein
MPRMLRLNIHIYDHGVRCFYFAWEGSKACHVLRAIQFVLQWLDIFHQILTVKLRI